VSAARGRSTDVVPTGTQAYFADKPQAVVRLLNSVLDLSRLTPAGFQPRDWRGALSEYVSSF
jgi:dTDP-4-dehydrorhamnose reductase